VRKAAVYYHTAFAGTLAETADGEYLFQYDSSYIQSHPTEFLTFTMPVRKMPYRSKRMFPFFDGLIPEGWLLEVAVANWRINANDRMGLLLACCSDCIGAVSVISISDANE